ncbi:alpha beta hydrolase fold family [Xylaria sp. FL1042]|nr:alpha beta hydrolase fold family [Xylaria sp. FL1042]
MIPNTRSYYLFIRIAIWCLRAVAPVSALYCGCALFGYHFAPLSIELLAYAEVLFFLFVSRPRQHILNKSLPKTIRRNRQERRILFEKCWSNVPDLESFMTAWFKGNSLDSICREDVKDFLAWGLLYKTKATIEDDEELEEYLHRTEDLLRFKFQPDYGPHRPLQVSTDALQLQHKPLIFYVMGIGVDDLMTYVQGRIMGLDHYRLSLRESLTVFPFRPHTVFTTHKSPSTYLSYWHRQHTATKRLPILFIHGIGAGMRTYTGFLRDIMETDSNSDGQVGIIALEIMPICMRITRGILPREELLREIVKVLNHHGWDRFVILGHSYGSIIATHLLHHPKTRHRVGPMLLVDPVTLSIHWGGIPYNFLYRQPRKASEWQLHYFASTDMGVAHSITRRFDWSENVLWKDDMKGLDISVALSEKDIILDPMALRDYLTSDASLQARQYTSIPSPLGQEGFGENGLQVLMYDNLNHAEIFDNRKDWIILVRLLLSYAEIGRKYVGDGGYY